MLLTDVVMPGMSGRELADRLAGQREGLKVLFMSGYPLDVIPAEAMTPDMVLLEKPFTARGLLTQLREVIEQPAPASLRTAPGAPSPLMIETLVVDDDPHIRRLRRQTAHRRTAISARSPRGYRRRPGC